MGTDNTDPFASESDSSSDVEETLLSDPPEHVAISDDDDDEEEDEAPARPSRKERRANRYRDLHEKVAGLERQLAERPPQPVYVHTPEPPPQRQQQDDVAPELQEVYQRQREVQAEYARLSEAEQSRRYDEFYAKAQRLDIQKNRIIARDAALSAAEHAQRSATANMVKTQNADIFNWKPPGSHPNAPPTGGVYFESVWKRMVHAEGKPDTHETMQAALSETRKVLRLGKSPDPTPSLKSKLTGAPRGGATHKESGAKSFPMTKDYKRLAKAAYPGLPEEKAYQRWVQKVGKSLLSGDDD